MSDCILWHGGTMCRGYGRIGRNTYAHRHIWEECFGPIQPGEVVHHVCENKLCINPEHLRLVSSQSDHIRIHRPGLNRWYTDGVRREETIGTSPRSIRYRRQHPFDPNERGVQ